MLIVFDWNGTLVDSEYRLSVEIAALATAAGYPIDVETIFQKYSALRTDLVFKAIAKQCGRPINAGLVTTLCRQHNRAREHLYETTGPDDVFDDVAQALAELQSAGHMQALCSNGRKDLLVSAVERTGLAGFFNGHVHTAKSLGLDPKPSGQPVHKVVTLCGGDPRKAVFIGDRPSDMQAACAAGVAHRIGFINRKLTGASHTDFGWDMSRAGATAFLSDYSKLPAMIASLD